MTRQIELRQLDSAGLRELLAMAVEETEPDETMPPMVGAPGWTPMRQAAFLGFFEPMLAGLTGPKRTIIYGIMIDRLTAGFIRLSLTDQAGVGETGIWLGRTWRGLGAGSAALGLLVQEAKRAGLHTLIADTTPGNAAAIGALRKLGATLRQGDKIYAQISI
jgi:RimJ/RimL family protein N-acetyltransferase